MLADHLSFDPFGGGKSFAALVSVDGAGPKNKKKRAALRCYKFNSKGHTSSSCMAPKPAKPDGYDESLPASAWMAYSLGAQSYVQTNQSKLYFNSGAF